MRNAALAGTDLRERLKPYWADRPVPVSGALFHATPEDRLASILQHGLQPRAENVQDAFPTRVHLTLSRNDAVRIARQLKQALVAGGVVPARWKGAYAVLRVEPPPGAVFFADGFFPGGVYSDAGMPPESIRLVGLIEAEAFLSRNWKRFWNWCCWGEGERPVFASRWPEPSQGCAPPAERETGRTFAI